VAELEKRLATRRSIAQCEQVANVGSIMGSVLGRAHRNALKYKKKCWVVRPTGRGPIVRARVLAQLSPQSRHVTGATPNRYGPHSAGGS
jgi:hypothetical protein